MASGEALDFLATGATTSPLKPSGETVLMFANIDAFFFSGLQMASDSNSYRRDSI